MIIKYVTYTNKVTDFATHSLIKWDGHVRGMDGSRITEKNLARKTDGIGPAGKPKDRWIFTVTKYRRLLENCCKPQDENLT